MLILEEQFYVGEKGFDFIVTTGLNMSGLINGQIRQVILRPNGSITNRQIPVTDILDTATGQVLVGVEEGDLVTPGRYVGQIYIQDNTGRARPSHPFAFNVVLGTAADPAALFV